MKLAEIKQALRKGPYAWPGGYPQYFLMGDGEALSFKAARQEWRQIVRAHFDAEGALPYYQRDQWFVVGVEINWENPELYCAHTDERIDCAYGEDPARVAGRRAADRIDGYDRDDLGESPDY